MTLLDSPGYPCGLGKWASAAYPKGPAAAEARTLLKVVDAGPGTVFHVIEYDWNHETEVPIWWRALGFAEIPADPWSARLDERGQIELLAFCAIESSWKAWMETPRGAVHFDEGCELAFERQSTAEEYRRLREYGYWDSGPLYACEEMAAPPDRYAKDGVPCDDPRGWLGAAGDVTYLEPGTDRAYRTDGEWARFLMPLGGPFVATANPDVALRTDPPGPRIVRRLAIESTG